MLVWWCEFLDGFQEKSWARARYVGSTPRLHQSRQATCYGIRFVGGELTTELEATSTASSGYGVPYPLKLNACSSL